MTESNKPSSTWYQVLVAAMLLLLPVVVLAQPGPPPDPDVPISGIEFLIGGGAILGLRRLFLARNSTRKK